MSSAPPPPYPGNPEGYPPPEKYGYSAPPPSAPGYPTQAAYPPPPPGNIHPPGYGAAPPGYGPPPPGYGPPPPVGHPGYGPPPPMGQPATTTVIVQPPVVMSFNETQLPMRCPKCNADIVTSIHYESGTLSWILCLILCFFGFFMGCCLIPFCIDSTKDVVHTCPNCHQHIGRYNRM